MKSLLHFQNKCSLRRPKAPISHACRIYQRKVAEWPVVCSYDLNCSVAGGGVIVHAATPLKEQAACTCSRFFFGDTASFTTGLYFWPHSRGARRFMPPHN